MSPQVPPRPQKHVNPATPGRGKCLPPARPAPLDRSMYIPSRPRPHNNLQKPQGPHKQCRHPRSPTNPRQGATGGAEPKPLVHSLRHKIFQTGNTGERSHRRAAHRQTPTHAPRVSPRQDGRVACPASATTTRLYRKIHIDWTQYHMKHTQQAMPRQLQTRCLYNYTKRQPLQPANTRIPEIQTASRACQWTMQRAAATTSSNSSSNSSSSSSSRAATHGVSLPLLG